MGTRRCRFPALRKKIPRLMGRLSTGTAIQNFTSMWTMAISLNLSGMIKPKTKGVFQNEEKQTYKKHYSYN